MHRSIIHRVAARPRRRRPRATTAARTAPAAAGRLQGRDDTEPSGRSLAVVVDARAVHVHSWLELEIYVV